jgi:hypothetical protein
MGTQKNTLSAEKKNLKINETKSWFLKRLTDLTNLYLD